MMFSLGSPPAFLVRPAPPPFLHYSINCSYVVGGGTHCRSPHCPPLLRPTTMKSNKTNNTHTKAATTTTTWIRSTATNKKTIPLCKIHPLVSLGPPSRRRYCDASGSLGKFRRRDSAAKVRSDTVAVVAVVVVVIVIVVTVVVTVVATEVETVVVVVVVVVVLLLVVVVVIVVVVGIVVVILVTVVVTVEVTIVVVVVLLIITSAIWEPELFGWQAHSEGDRAISALWELEILWRQAQSEGDKATTAVWDLEIFWRQA